MIAKITIAMVLMSSLAANAAPPPGIDENPSLHAWFEAQHSATGAWCCNVSDGHVLNDEDWRSEGTGYQVRIAGAWVSIPTSALRDPKGGPNPTGRAIVWFTTGDYGLRVYCFAPGWEG